MDVVKLTSDIFENYESFLLKRKDTLFYSSLKCRDMIKRLLNAEDHYLVATEADSVVGVLPCFIQTNEDYGSVINSLPYYGSNGGIIADNDQIKDCLIEEFKKIVKDRNCVASTIIDSPYDNSYDYYMKALNPDMTDKRRGVITPLPTPESGGVEELRSRIHKRKAQVISDLRKAERNGIWVDVENNKEAFDFLKKTHEDNMSVIGGPAKKKEFFEYVFEKMVPGDDYNLYIAYKDNERIAAVLLFYFNKTVEYYVPVVVQEYRTYQALSLVIFKAMADSIENGYENWNWGGTGMTMDGVFKFKMKWASEEHVYNYYTNIYDKSILKVDKEIILAGYPNFYVYNFSMV